jgi:hypothetical protein
MLYNQDLLFRIKALIKEKDKVLPLVPSALPILPQVGAVGGWSLETLLQIKSKEPRHTKTLKFNHTIRECVSFSILLPPHQ